MLYKFVKLFLNIISFNYHNSSEMLAGQGLPSLFY